MILFATDEEPMSTSICRVTEIYESDVIPTLYNMYELGKKQHKIQVNSIQCYFMDEALVKSTNINDVHPINLKYISYL